MKQKLLLSELELKKLRDRVQHLQNELIRVSWGWGAGERAGGEEGKGTGGCPEMCLGAERREAWREGGMAMEDSAVGSSLPLPSPTIRRMIERRSCSSCTRLSSHRRCC